MWRRLVFCAALSLSGLANAADLNVEGDHPRSNSDGFNLCEQLFHADLSGHYVVTNEATRRSSLIELRQLGVSNSYTVSVSRLNLASEGFRELGFEDTKQGWLIQSGPDARVNVVSMGRTGNELAFMFQGSDQSGARIFYGVPSGEDAVRGNILRPDGFSLQFRDGVQGRVHFTRVILDRAFENTVTQSLKSLLATRLHGENPGEGNYVLFVEMKRPMTLAEACRVLGTEHTCALEPEELNANQRSYRFAVMKDVYEFLEAVGQWNRRYEVIRIDSVPSRVLSPDLLRRIISRRGGETEVSAKAGGPQAAATPVPAPQAAPSAAPSAAAGPQGQAPQPDDQASRSREMGIAAIEELLGKNQNQPGKPGDQDQDKEKKEEAKPTHIGGRPVIQVQPGKPDKDKK